MTRRSGRLQKRSENATGPKNKGGKKMNRKKPQPLSKLLCEKNQLVLECVAKTPIVSESPVKGATIHCDEHDCQLHIAGDSLIWPSPLPYLSCVSHEDVQVKMSGKEQNDRRSKSFMQKHPSIQPRMRSILIDWLIEVSEEYTLQRQTFYLAQDYFDRFMLTQNNVDKGVLQLIGITCLFIASKMEEACPPKLSQMAHVTAGTYYEEEVLQMELIILKALRWKLCPETAVSWLNLYFQMLSMNASSDLLEPQFPQDLYIQMTRLLDLCILSMNSLDFQNRVLAASVLCHFLQREAVEKVSGLRKEEIQSCVSWMTPFVESASQCGRVTQKDFAQIKVDGHNIQTYTEYLTMLDTACAAGRSHKQTDDLVFTEKTCAH